MFDFLEKLRRKPLWVKKQIAFFTAFLFVGIIFVVWLTVWLPDMRALGNKQAEAAAKIEPGPVDSLFENFRSGFSGIGEQIDKIKNITNGLSSDGEHYVATTTGTSTFVPQDIQPVDPITLPATSTEMQ